MNGQPNIRGSSLIKIAALSDYFGWLPPLRNLLKKRETKRTAKRVSKNNTLIEQQGAASRTVRFRYKNKAGVDRVREVEPYEIKDGFLWGREHGQQSIKRYFLKGINKLEAGSNQFEPAWEVKLGSQLMRVSGLG